MTTEALWWQRGVVYQIYPRSFKDSNGDGIGDLQGIIAELDYIKWLGVDAIWLSPIFASPMADFGYDVSDYRAIHPDFGTLDDFDALLNAVYQRDLRLLLDFVPNHTSDQHRWFIESRSSRDNPKRDWYIWRDPKPDGSPPNNWLSYFGGNAWTFDEHTGQYYMHNFLSAQPELNWRNPEVEEAMFDNLRFWLDRGVDGFRVDVIDRIIKDGQFRDNPPNPNWQEGGFGVGRFQRVYSEQRPEVVDVFKRFRALFDSYDRNRVVIGELAYDATLEQMATYCGTVNDPGLHLAFNFHLIETEWKAEAVKAHIDAYDAILPNHATPNFVLGNHDKPRLASQIGVQQARIAAMLLLTLRGTPTLYYGDEIGMTNVEIPPDKIQDPQGANNAGFNRDEARTPMQWDERPHAGFCPPDATPWLSLSDDAGAINVVMEREYNTSMLSLYHQLLQFRRETPALHSGKYIPLDTGPWVFSYLREYGDERYLIALNFTGGLQTIRLDDMPNGAILFSTMMDGYRKPDFSIRLEVLNLRPHEGIIARLTTS